MLRDAKILYDRIVVKWKSKKLALIVVGNKLLKQVFSIVKNGAPYNIQYRGSLVNNQVNFS